MSRVGLWSGLVGAPLVWMVTLTVAFGLTPWACTRQHARVLHIVTVLGIAAALAAGMASWRAWAAVGRRRDDGPGETRQRFMAGLGVATSALFALVILAMEVPVLLLRVCD